MGDDPGAVAGYRLRARLGAGGMGRVYLAFTPGGRPVALKVIRGEFGEDADFRARFRQEVEAARQVHGLYTAQLLDADPDAPRPWLVTAYVAGPSLAQAVREHGPMPEQTVLQLMAGVAEALQAIHGAGVVHRDLKPSNVLLAADGPRVIDFGIARAAEATAITRTGMRVGSPHYMAPEQIAAGRVVSPAIDIFALGALATFAAVGRPPFGDGGEAGVLYRILHESPDLAGCPEPLRGLIARCLAKEGAARPWPAEIIAGCRAAIAGNTLEMAQSWLPPAVAGALAQHAVPAPGALPPVPPSAGAPAPAGPADPAGPPAPKGSALPAAARAAAGAAAGAILGDAGALAGDAAAPPGHPAGQGAAEVPTVGVAGGPTRELPTGQAPGRARWRPSRAAAIGTAAAVRVAAALGGTLLLLRNPPPGHRHGAIADSAATSPAPGTRGAGGTGSTSPSAKPAPGACVVGKWKGVAEDIPVRIDNQSVQYIGRGADQIFRANGTSRMDYGRRTVYRVTVNGSKWTYVITGSAALDWQVRGSTMYNSDVRPHGHWVLLENGAYNNSGPLSIDSKPGPYSCTPTTLRIYESDGGSVVLSRVTPKPQPGS